MNILKKIMTSIANVFRKLQTAKDVVRQLSKKSRFRRPFDKQHCKRSRPFLKSVGQHFYQIYWSLWSQLSWKKSVIVIWKILGLFVNILTADEKYSLVNRDSLMQHIQTQLSKKEKTFSQFFSVFLKCRLRVKHFRKKVTLTLYVFPELRLPKDMVR